MGGLIKGLLARIEALFGVYNVVHYGADPTGTNDSFTAIQNAINACPDGGTLYFPPGQYLINTCLNFTNRYGLKIVGSSGIGLYNTLHGSVIVGNTGGLALDFTGCYQFHIKDVAVTQGSTNKSTIGMLFARSSVNNYSEYNKLENVYISMTNGGSTLNSNAGSIGIYNLEAEIMTLSNCHIIADSPCIVTDNNIYNIASVYATIWTTVASMSVFTANEGTTFYASGLTNSAFYAYNAENITLDGVYFETGASPTNNFAVTLNQCYAVKIFGNADSYGRAICLQRLASYIDVKITVGITAAPIRVDGTGTQADVEHAVFRVIDKANLDTTATGYKGNMFELLGTVYNMRDIDITLAPGQSINVSTLSAATLWVVRAYSWAVPASITLPSGQYPFVITEDYIAPSRVVWENGTTANRPGGPIVGQRYYDTSLGKPIWCKTAAVNEVDSLTITAAATSAGNVTVTLNGTATNVAVASGDSMSTVASKINSTAFSGWTTSLSGSTVTFTATSSGPKSAPSYSAGTTAATGTMSVSTAGANAVWADATGTSA